MRYVERMIMTIMVSESSGVIERITHSRLVKETRRGFLLASAITSLHYSHYS